MTIVLLVRHGQASLRAADYDQLSDLGREQAGLVAAALAARGIDEPRIVRGEHRRHAQTVEGAAWPTATVDRRWNEFDHRQILDVSPLDRMAPAERETAWLQGKERWAGGEHDDDYEMTYAEFARRAISALDEVANDLPEGRPAIAVTSAGVIAAVVSALLRGGPEMWLRLQTVTVNAGITKVSLGRRGRTLISFNDHAHLEPDLVTYR